MKLAYSLIKIEPRNYTTQPMRTAILTGYYLDI